jgi:hypothetical protein
VPGARCRLHLLASEDHYAFVVQDRQRVADGERVEAGNLVLKLSPRPLWRMVVAEQLQDDGPFGSLVMCASLSVPPVVGRRRGTVLSEGDTHPSR